jgi:hypothetical protein
MSNPGAAADVLKSLKRDYGAKFVVRQGSGERQGGGEVITLILLNRGRLDGPEGVSRIGGLKDIEYDAGGGVHALLFKGFKVVLLAKSDCG